MLYRQRFNTFIHILGDSGYIANHDTFGELFVDSSGIVFLKALSRSARLLQEMINDVAQTFTDTPLAVLENDATEFYTMLEKTGFILSGETEMELDKKDTRFSYKEVSPKTVKRDFSPVYRVSENNSKKFFHQFCLKKHQLSTLEIQITSCCNERCVHCYIPHKNKDTHMDVTLFQSVLEQCNDLGVFHLIISGGEPMSHPQFLEMLRRIKKYNFSFEILSNLTLLNDEILQEIKESHIFSIAVSLYSMESGIHDSITQVPGSFAKTYNAILTLIENDVPLIINCPIMKQNKDSYPAVYTWALAHKIRAQAEYVIFGQYDSNTDNLSNRLGETEIESVVSGIISIDYIAQQRYLATVSQDSSKEDIANEQLCTACETCMTLDEKGSLYPCPSWHGDYKLGNVYTQTMQEVWEHSPKVEYIRSLRKKDFPKCVHCENRIFCSSCLACNANESPEGNPFEISEYFCKVAAITRKVVRTWQTTTQTGTTK